MRGQLISEATPRDNFFFPVRPRDAHGPYLERMASMHDTDLSVSQRNVEDRPSVHIQPIAIPDLSHTGVRTSFTYKGANFMRPDGRVSGELQTSIRKQVASLPARPLVDTSDVAYIDLVRSMKRSTLAHSARASLLSRPDLAEDSRANAGKSRGRNEDVVVEEDEDEDEVVGEDEEYRSGARRLKKVCIG